MKKPSMKEKVEVYEKFLFRLNFHRTITLNEERVKALLALADEWVTAHGGERTSKEIDENINHAFEKLKNLP